MARHKDKNWDLCDGADVNTASLAVLMDLRDELKGIRTDLAKHHGELATLNNVFRCGNFLAIPGVLRAIRRNTAKPRAAKARATKHQNTKH